MTVNYLGQFITAVAYLSAPGPVLTPAEILLSLSLGMEQYAAGAHAAGGRHRSDAEAKT